MMLWMKLGCLERNLKANPTSFLSSGLRLQEQLLLERDPHGHRNVQAFLVFQKLIQFMLMREHGKYCTGSNFKTEDPCFKTNTISKHGLLQFMLIKEDFKGNAEILWDNIFTFLFLRETLV